MSYNLILIIIIHFVVKLQCKPIPSCYFGAFGKCLGVANPNPTHGYPSKSNEMIQNYTIKSSDDCNINCTKNKQCFMSAYNVSTKQCSLFQGSGYKYFPTGLIIGLWECCKTISKYKPRNRCRGYYIYTENSKAKNKVRIDPLLVTTASSDMNCLHKCFRIAVCGGINIYGRWDVNILNKRCELLLQFPPNKIKSHDNKNWTSMIWKCSDDYELEDPSQICHKRVRGSTGFWKIENKSRPLIKYKKGVIGFFTNDVKDCWKNCEYYKQCNRAWYSKESFYCYLQSSGKPCHHIMYFDNGVDVYNYTTYIWHDCKNTPSITSQFIFRNQCRRINSNKYIHIANVDCGTFPKNSSFVKKCDENSLNTLIYSDALHCLNYQSFRVLQILNKRNEKLQSMDIYSNLTWVLVTSGYEAIWLINVTQNNFELIPDDYCQLFNAKDEYSHFNDESQVIGKDKWFNLPPYEAELPFSKSPVKYAVVSITHSPRCNCFSEIVCSNAIRDNQIRNRHKFDQIPFNFMITGNGMVYEGKGWENETQADTSDYNKKSICFALTGVFHESPPLKQILALKNLLIIAVQKGKLQKNYTLLPHDDISNIKTDTKALNTILALWPGFRGHRAQPCHILSTTVISLNIIIIITFLLVMLLITHYFYHRIYHDQFCDLLRNCVIETIYSSKCDDTFSLQTKIPILPIKTLAANNVMLSTFTSSLFWIELKKEIKISFTRTHSENCNCRKSVFANFNLKRSQAKLLNSKAILNSNELNNCPMFTALCFQRFCENTEQIILIFHFLDMKKFQSEFINRLHKKQCVCDAFRIYQYKPCSKYLFPSLIETYEIIKGNRLDRSKLNSKYCFLIDSTGFTQFFDP